MGIKTFIALLMGLVIQLSQVQVRAAPEPSKSCATAGQRMGCCEGLKSCPCAKKSDPKEKPAPLIPASAELKLFVSKASVPVDFDTIYFPQSVHTRVRKSHSEPRNGYAGVPLSVAFCSFVI